MGPDRPLAEAPASDAAPSEGPDLRRILSDRVNLREGPGTDAPTLGLLREDDEVAVLAAEGDWLRIRTESGAEGWISARFVAAADDGPSLPGARPPG
ncbi:hypothetical protein Rumeso_02925 [Rubellimicrobium mesophilum DSM 19309]|uniref:SH3b domain-containing protein n=1 Tax=Rubellimicrobium mesophilum DSM 19309 TaxID=442562 RepID=A0A017HMX0_9RHOB|nr:SH3 domain-containing protein [Rubellimicrobium mesophilum]EYD75498.1 hypothetical protein Rumeso_02925 [Rubellimicrobium mesophilum DSM 19309]